MNKNEPIHIDPELDKILRQNNPRKIFQVPDNYFEQLPDQIMAQINASEIRPKQKKNAFVLKFVRYGVGVAASALIVIAAIFLINRDSVQGDALFAELEYEEQYNYLFSDPDDLSLIELTDLTGEESITEIETELYSIIPEDLADEFELEDLGLFYEK